MGVRPTQGQAWKRYAVLGDPRPADGQVWPRYSGVYVPPSGDLFWYDVAEVVWPIGTDAPDGVSFGPVNASVYQYATHLAPTDDWIVIDAPNSGGGTAIVQPEVLAVLRDIDGNQVGATNIVAETVFSFVAYPEWPAILPDTTAFYFEFFNSGFDIWTTFNIPGETFPPYAGDPVYCDVPVIINGSPYTIRYFDNGYVSYGPYSFSSLFESNADNETGRDFIHVVLTPDWTPSCVVWKLSTDGGTNYFDVTRSIVPDPGDPGWPSDPIHPVMQDYDKTSPTQGLDILLGLYNISGNYMNGITDLSGLFIQVIIGLPGYPAEQESGPRVGQYGPMGYPTTIPGGPFNQPEYNIPRPQ